MANTAKRGRNKQNLRDLPLEERAKWLLERLREQPGTVVKAEDGTGLLLLRATHLRNLLRQLAPELTHADVNTVSRWLVGKHLVNPVTAGQGRRQLYISLPAATDAEAAAETGEEEVDAEDIEQVTSDTIMALTAKLEKVRAALVAEQREKAHLREQLRQQRLTGGGILQEALKKANQMLKD